MKSEEHEMKPGRISSLLAGDATWKSVVLTVSLLVFCSPAIGQVITTVAGGGDGNGGPALQAFFYPSTVALDRSGNLYIADRVLRKIRKVAAGSGTISTFAGNGNAEYSGDGGNAVNAGMEPLGIAFDPDGNLHVAGNHRVRKIAAVSGIITTVAGTGSPGDSGDGGAASAANLRDPAGIDFDAAGNLYIADYGNDRIRRVNRASGTISTVAGNGRRDVTGDGGPAIAASLAGPQGIALDAAGNLLIADSLSNRIRRVDAATGIISRIAGTGDFGYSGDNGPAVAARIYTPMALAVDSAGNLYIADSDNRRIRKVAAGSGIITTVAGTGVNGFAGDLGPGVEARLGSPRGIMLTPAGDLLIADYGNYRVRSLSLPTGNIRTIAGNGEHRSGDGGSALDAGLGYASQVALDHRGNLFLMDGRIRKVDALTGRIEHFGGNESIAYSGDGGPAIQAGFSVSRLAVDSKGDLHIADSANNRVRKISSSTGIITTVAGNGSAIYSGDGAAATSSGMSVSDIAFDFDDNLYIADAVNNRVYMIAAGTSIVATLSGDGRRESSGDGGPARSARLSQPSRIAIDGSSNIYLLASDIGSDGSTRPRIRKLAAQGGTITTVAGGGAVITSNDLGFPFDIGSDSAGNLFVLQIARIQRLGAATQTLDDYSGIGFWGYSGDGGPAANATIYAVTGNLSIGASGDLTFGDTVNRRVRKIVSALAFDRDKLAFGGYSVGAAPPAQAVVVRNTTPVATPVEVTLPRGFKASHDCTTLAPGASCRVVVTFIPDADIPFRGLLTVTSRHGVQAAMLSGNGERSLVTHYYNSILRRSPDAPGKAFWESEVTRLQGLGANDVSEVWFAMAQSFFASAEYLALNRNNAGFVTDLYNTFFARAPDAAGLADWSGKLASGMPREVVLAAFMFSPEFIAFTRNLYGVQYTHAEIATVIDFYRGLLARLPDGAGFAFWLKEFRAAQCRGPAAVTTTAEWISRQFTLIEEYTQRNRTNAQYVGDLYNAFLRRGADLDGVKYWISQLDSGARTRDNVRRAFVDSPEFSARVASIANGGCLQ